MNEVRMSQLTPQPVTSAASSQGIATTRSLPPQSGNTLPVKETLAPEQVVNVETLDKIDQAGRTESIKEAATLPVEVAVTEINDYVQSVQRDLQFFVDEDSGVTVVRVRDKETGDLIRQIPEDIFLNLAQKLKEDNTLNLLNAYG
jgi:flagellar protein FlaG